MRWMIVDVHFVVLGLLQSLLGLEQCAGVADLEALEGANGLSARTEASQMPK